MFHAKVGKLIAVTQFIDFTKHNRPFVVLIAIKEWNFEAFFCQLERKIERSLPHVSINYFRDCMCDHFLWWLFNVSWPECIYRVIFSVESHRFFPHGKTTNMKTHMFSGLFFWAAFIVEHRWVSVQNTRALWTIPTHMKIITTLCCPHVCTTQFSFNINFDN